MKRGSPIHLKYRVLSFRAENADDKNSQAKQLTDFSLANKSKKGETLCHSHL
jgi:hypothetical protein